MNKAATYFFILASAIYAAKPTLASEKDRINQVKAIEMSQDSVDMYINIIKNPHIIKSLKLEAELSVDEFKYLTLDENEGLEKLANIVIDLYQDSSYTCNSEN